MQVVLAASVAEDAVWSAYEHCFVEQLPESVPPAFCSLVPSAAAGAADSETAEIELAMAAATAEVEATASTGTSTDAKPDATNPVEACEAIRSALLEACVMTPIDESDNEAKEEAAEEARMLADLEVQVSIITLLMTRSKAEHRLYGRHLHEPTLTTGPTP